MKTLRIVALFSFFFLLPIFAYRWIFFYHYDSAYMKSWYEQSQWSIPQSTRLMGDAELYQYAGEQIIHGDDVFHINPEVPPLGKYFYGAAAVWLGNPYLMSLFFYIGCVGAFFMLTRILFVQKSKRAIANLLFLTSPFFFSQIGQIGLELPQLFFLLLFLICLFYSPAAKKWRWVLTAAAGISLGAFAGIKFALFLPVLMGVACVFYWRSKRLHHLLVLFAACGATYLLLFAPYFLAHHTVIDWVKAEKWVVHFYLISQVKSVPFLVFLTLVSGVFISWWRQILLVREWTIAWLLSLCALAVGAVTYTRSLKTHTVRPQWEALTLISLGFLVITSLIPFWPRYLVTILPLLLLFVPKILARRRMLIVAVFLVIFAQELFYIRPQPTEFLQFFADEIKQGNTLELYNNLDAASQRSISRTEFSTTLRRASEQMEATERDVHFGAQPFVFPWQASTRIPVAVTYHTSIGNYTTQTTLTLRRERNSWKVAWNWDAVAPQFRPGSFLFIEKTPVRDGTLMTSNGKTLSGPGAWPYIWITPGSLQDLNQTMILLNKLTQKDVNLLRASALFVSDPNQPLGIGFLSPHHDRAQLATISQLRGVFVDDLSSRIYTQLSWPPQHVYVTQAIEEKHPEVFAKPGGELRLLTNQGRVFVLLQTPAANGQDVQLPEKFEQIFPL